VLVALQAQQGVDTAVHVLMGAGVAAAVTVARVALLQRWPEFKQATDASNSQVLTPLEGNVGEIAQVAVFPVRIPCCLLSRQNVRRISHPRPSYVFTLRAQSWAVLGISWDLGGRINEQRVPGSVLARTRASPLTMLHVMCSSGHQEPFPWWWACCFDCVVGTCTGSIGIAMRLRLRSLFHWSVCCDDCYQMIIDGRASSRMDEY
jgi:hypothetical protein